MREIICQDSIPWLRSHKDVGAIITSLPDAEEIGMEYAQWKTWFWEAAELSMRATTSSAPCIFYQTDRKVDGRLSSKAYLLMKIAQSIGHKILWHKVVLRREPGALDLFRPGFSHLLAFSAEMKSGKATTDVMEKGSTVYPNAFSMQAARLSINFAIASKVTTIVDPFCGRGTIPALVESAGLNAIGIDIDPAQCEAAKTLRFGKP